MRRDAMAAWLSGTREDMRDEMSIAELRQYCDDAERRQHRLRDEHEWGEARGGNERGGARGGTEDQGFVWSLSPAERARLHNALLSAVRARAVHKLAEEVRIYRQLQLAVRHVEEREALEVLRGAPSP